MITAYGRWSDMTRRSLKTIPLLDDKIIPDKITNLAAKKKGQETRQHTEYKMMLILGLLGTVEFSPDTLQRISYTS